MKKYPNNKKRIIASHAYSLTICYLRGRVCFRWKKHVFKYIDSDSLM